MPRDLQRAGNEAGLEVGRFDELDADAVERLEARPRDRERRPGERIAERQCSERRDTAGTGRQRWVRLRVELDARCEVGFGRPEPAAVEGGAGLRARRDRKSTRLNSSHGYISYAVFCLKKKTIKDPRLC